MNHTIHRAAGFGFWSTIIVGLLKDFREKAAAFVKQAEIITTIVTNYTYPMDSIRTRLDVLMYLFMSRRTKSAFGVIPTSHCVLPISRPSCMVLLMQKDIDLIDHYHLNVINQIKS